MSNNEQQRGMTPEQFAQARDEGLEFLNSVTVVFEDRRGEAQPALLALLAEVTDAIEAYADDHNTDRPTDVTVLLPRLRRALGR